MNAKKWTSLQLIKTKTAHAMIPVLPELELSSEEEHSRKKVPQIIKRRVRICGHSRFGRRHQSDQAEQTAKNLRKIVWDSSQLCGLCTQQASDERNRHIVSTPASASKSVDIPNGSSDRQMTMKRVKDISPKQPRVRHTPHPKQNVDRKHTASKPSTHLSKEKFCEAVHKLAVQKFTKCSNADIAWRHLVEGHLMPVADRRAGKFDEYMTTLLSPVVAETLTEWESSLKLTFRVRTPIPQHSSEEYPYFLPVSNKATIVQMQEQS